MARKTLLVLVEGPSDEDVIAGALRAMYSNRNVDGFPYHFDITTVRIYQGNAKQNGYIWNENTSMRQMIRETIERYLMVTPERTWHDISHIIHVTDLDGAFVDDSMIIKDESASKIKYDLHAMYSDNPDKTAERNREKKRSLNELIGVNRLTLDKWSVPYRLFYMGRNLEHAFIGNVDNLSDKEKERISAQLETLFRTHPDTYRVVVERLWRMQGGLSWRESWNQVKIGDNSLQRGSNLYLVDEFIRTTRAGRND